MAIDHVKARTKVKSGTHERMLWLLDRYELPAESIMNDNRPMTCSSCSRFTLEVNISKWIVPRRNQIASCLDTMQLESPSSLSDLFASCLDPMPLNSQSSLSDLLERP